MKVYLLTAIISISQIVGIANAMEIRTSSPMISDTTKARMLKEVYLHGTENIKTSLDCMGQHVNTWQTISGHYFTKLPLAIPLLISTSQEQARTLIESVSGFHIIEKSSIITLNFSLITPARTYTYKINFSIGTYFDYISLNDNTLIIDVIVNPDKTLTIIQQKYITTNQVPLIFSSPLLTSKHARNMDHDWKS